jgi:polyphosphate kinase
MTETESGRYINRELSWLQFDDRVLSEAENPDNPVLERLKFLSIFESNLDEFFMVRVSGLVEQIETGVAEPTPDGMTPTEQIAAIVASVRRLRRRATALWSETIQPQLEDEGIAIRKYTDLSPKLQKRVDKFFRDAVFPVCTPLLLQPSASFPFISNRSLNIAIELGEGAHRSLARIKVPDVIPRLVRAAKNRQDFILIEDLIANHLHEFFPGVEIQGHYMFRVIRDADIEIREIEAADLISAVEQSLHLRRFGDVALLEVAAEFPKKWRKTLMQRLPIDEEFILESHGLMGFDVFLELSNLDRPRAKFPPHRPFLDDRLSRSQDLFTAIKKRDVLLHHPYDSFRPVEEFVASAAHDSDVIGIKQTLYRVGAESPIVESLLRAAENGKQVAVMVELKARFDESNNLIWSRALERAGVHVTYGFPEMKTHCKLCLVVRKERNSIRTYAHIGTGNYNPNTARLYTDLGLFTSDPDVCRDASELFNYLTGLSRQTSFRKLLVAPLDLRERIIALIHDEAESHRQHGNGLVMLKLNSLVDPEVIDALYEASAAGVKADLLVRGICCLKPGIAGLSENVRVRSIVGRFLEHSRAYYFHNDGDPRVYIGSADMMRRNLDRRIEVIVPLAEAGHKRYVRENVFEVAFQDNTNAWELHPNGEYVRLQPPSPGEAFTSQTALLSRPASGPLGR